MSRKCDKCHIGYGVESILSKKLCDKCFFDYGDSVWATVRYRAKQNGMEELAYKAFMAWFSNET